MTNTTRWIAVMTSVILLLSLCGCDGGKTPTDTTTTTAPTTTAPVTETPRQFGGKTFTLGGKTFEIGGDPKPLLEFLGEPDTAYDTFEPVYGANKRVYEYGSVIVETCWVEGHTPEQLVCVYFEDNTYSFDGIAVGDTVENLDALVSSKREPNRGVLNAGFRYGGLSYAYEAEENQGFRWIVLFSDEGYTPDDYDAYADNNFHVPANSKIQHIILFYNYFPIVKPYFEQQ